MTDVAARTRPRQQRGRRGAPPISLVGLSLAALALLVLPLIGLLLRAPWDRFFTILASPEVVEALRLSVVAAAFATAICVVLGVPLAWLLAWVDFRGRSIVRAIVTVPLVLPPVIGGVALLVAFGRNGFVGRWLESAFGISLPFTTAGVVLAQTFVAMPFLIVSVEGALRSADRRFEDVAATLGASPWTILRRVTLPSVAPGIVAGAVLSFARALGEFGATITFAGNFPGTTRTLPLAAYVAIGSGDVDTAIVLSLVLLSFSVAILAALRNRWLVRA